MYACVYVLCMYVHVLYVLYVCMYMYVLYVCMYMYCMYCTMYVCVCVCTTSSAYSISKEATSVLQEAIQTGEEVSMAEHTTKCRTAVRNAIKKKEEA